MKRLCLVCSAVVALSGCRGITALLTIWMPNPETAAKVDLKGDTIVVMTTVSPQVPDRHVMLVQDVASEFRKELVKHLPGKKIIDDEQMFAFRNSRPDWTKLTREQVGEHFKADHVVELEVRRVRCTTRGSAAEYRAELSGTIRAVDLPKPDPDLPDPPRSKVTLDEAFHISYPPPDQFEMDVRTTPELFRQKFKRLAAWQYALWFYPHPSRQRARDTSRGPEN